MKSWYKFILIIGQYFFFLLTLTNWLFLEFRWNSTDKLMDCIDSQLCARVCVNAFSVYFTIYFLESVSKILYEIPLASFSSLGIFVVVFDSILYVQFNNWNEIKKSIRLALNKPQLTLYVYSMMPNDAAIFLDFSIKF